jgi:hypothetical protein
MSGSLQTKVYGGHRHSTTVLKKAGHYNNAPVKRMGFYNGAVKRLGVYNGVGGSKNNLIGEMYPHY